jgi:predicted HNH restriction endonuclease
MAWIIQSGDKDLTTVEQIDSLNEKQIKKVCLKLKGDHFDRDEVEKLLEKGKKAKATEAKATETKGSPIAPVCKKIKDALNRRIFKFDLFRQISGWLDTSKPGGDIVEDIMKELFYDQVFDRFTEHDNQKLSPDFREEFLPWLKRVFNSQEVVLRDNEQGELESGVDGKPGLRFVTTYERKPHLKKKAKDIYGLKCMVCGFNFENTYGDYGKDYIHVHHRVPVSKGEQTVNPKDDLCVVCANCHAMIHRRRDNTLTLDELEAMIEEQKELRE